MAKTADIIRSFVGVAITMGLAILFIIMYEKHKDQHCDKPLQIWMLVMGISQVASTILTVSGFLTIYSKSGEEEESKSLQGEQKPKSSIASACMGCIVCLFGLFLLAWFIVGNVWTFGMSPNHGEKHCNQTVYLLCFWYIIACYIFTGVMCCIGCIAACCLMRK